MGRMGEGVFSSCPGVITRGAHTYRLWCLYTSGQCTQSYEVHLQCLHSHGYSCGHWDDSQSIAVAMKELRTAILSQHVYIEDSRGSVVCRDDLACDDVIDVMVLDVNVFRLLVGPSSFCDFFG